MPGTHRLSAGSPIRLAATTTKAADFHNDRKAAEKEFKTLRAEFIRMQAKLYAEQKQKLLIVLQAMDAGGKDGTIRNILKGVNPQGVRVTSFKKPTAEELSRDFLWRIHKAVPGNGMIRVFNRSHYEDVLVVRVNEIVPENVWRPRFAAINQFEKHLTDNGTTVLKFFLHISKEEQAERFQERLDDDEKHWKFDPEDLEKRKQWDEYQSAFEEMLNQCTTDYAPWYLIPADQKWYRNLAIMRVVDQTLKQMNPRFPKSEDLTGITID